MGRAHLYVLDLGPDEMHENDAAAQLSWLVAGRGVSISTPAQGKVNLTAQSRGLLKISVRGGRPQHHQSFDPFHLVHRHAL